VARGEGTTAPAPSARAVKSESRSAGLAFLISPLASATFVAVSALVDYLGGTAAQQQMRQSLGRGSRDAAHFWL